MTQNKNKNGNKNVEKLIFVGKRSELREKMPIASKWERDREREKRDGKKLNEITHALYTFFRATLLNVKKKENVFQFYLSDSIQCSTVHTFSTSFIFFFFTKLFSMHFT